MEMRLDMRLLGETLTSNAALGRIVILGGMFIANWDEYSALLNHLFLQKVCQMKEWGLDFG